MSGTLAVGAVLGLVLVGLGLQLLWLYELGQEILDQQALTPRHAGHLS